MKTLSVALVASAIGWYVFIEWFCHKRWRKHGHNHGGPGTKFLSLVGALGAVLLLAFALAITLLK